MFKYQFRWDTVWGSFDFLMSGLQMTLIVSAATLVLAMLGGLLIAGLDMSRWRALRWLGVSFGEIIRNTPIQRSARKRDMSKSAMINPPIIASTRVAAEMIKVICNPDIRKSKLPHTVSQRNWYLNI